MQKPRPGSRRLHAGRRLGHKQAPPRLVPGPGSRPGFDATENSYDTSTAVRHRFPGARIIGVEPEVANDWVLSLRAGERILIDPPPTIADGVRTRIPGVNNFAQVRATVDDVLTVTEAEIRAAVRFLAQRMKLVVEPTGAIPVAMLFSGRLGDLRGKRVGLVISGGNVDADVLCEILNEPGASES